jgi:hypothetical protein
VHIHEEDARRVYNRYRREAMAFKQIYPEAHFNLYDFVRLTAINMLSDLRHAARAHALWRSFASVPWFRAMQFWGTYQGYRHSGAVTQHLRQTFYYPRGMDAGESSARDVERIRYDHPQ